MKSRHEILQIWYSCAAQSGCEVSDDVLRRQLYAKCVDRNQQVIILAILNSDVRNR